MLLPVVSALVASAVALGGAFWWRRRAAVLVASAAAAAVVSLVDTAAYRGPGGNEVAAWLLVETLFLLFVLAQVVRRPPVRVSASVGALVFAAITLSPLRIGLRFTPPAPAWEIVVVCGSCALLASVAVAVGGYLRWLDRSVIAARREQRIQLARDLHDWVTHEMTGIVLEAQAGRLAVHDPVETARTLTHIEEAGVRGLDAMDRTLRLLRDAGEASVAGSERLPTLAEVRDVAHRFSARTPARVEVEIDDGLDPVRPETVTTVHRVVLESLTNVRRHAATASLIRIRVAREESGLLVSVTDDGRRSAPRTRPGGGTGLAGLAERVEAVGGTLTCGPTVPAGWAVRAVLPVRS